MLLANINQSIKKSKTFWKLLISYILLITVSLLILFIVLYNKFTNTTLSSINKAQKMNLLQTSYTVNLMLNSLKLDAFQLLYDTDMIAYVYNNSHANDIARTKSLMDKITFYTDSNSIIHSIYLYNGIQKGYLTTYGFYDDNDFFDGTIKEYLSNLNNKKDFALISTHKFVLPNESSNLISIVVIKRNSDDSINSAVILNIDESIIHNLIKNANLVDNNNTIFIIDGIGQIISHSNKNLLYSNISNTDYYRNIKSFESNSKIMLENINSKSYGISFVTDSNNWKYIYMSNYKNMLKDVIDIKNMAVLVLVIIILVAIITSYYSARNLYSPITNLLRFIKQSVWPLVDKTPRSIYTDEFSYIKNAFENINDKAQSLEKDFEINLPLLRESFISNILKGRITDMNTIMSNMIYLNLQLGISNNAVVIIKVNKMGDLLYDIKQSHYMSSYINTTFNSIISTLCTGYMVEFDEDYFVFLLSFSECIDALECKSKTLAIANQLHNEVAFNFTISIGIGNIKNNLIDAQYSFNEALNTLRYCTTWGISTIVSWDTIADLMDVPFSYPFDKERQLINNLKIGNMVEIQRILNEIEKEIYNLSEYEHGRILYMILLSIYHAMLELNIFNASGTISNTIYNEFLNIDNINQKNTYIINLCGEIISTLKQRNTNKNSILIDKVINYIDKNISKDISLDEVSKMLDITPNYLSKLFKDIIGKNFSDILIEKRMEMAINIITNNKNIKITEIYKQIGFSSPQYFSQVFKKFYGVSPSTYKIENKIE